MTSVKDAIIAAVNVVAADSRCHTIRRIDVEEKAAHVFVEITTVPDAAGPKKIATVTFEKTFVAGPKMTMYQLRDER